MRSTLDASGDDVLEGPVPLHESQLWNLQRAFYESHGIDIWANGSMSMFISSNAYIAMCYAKFIMSYLTDWFKSPYARRDEPVYVIEAGAGHGRLSFLIMKEILAMWRQWPDMNPETPANSKKIIEHSFGKGPNKKLCPLKFVLTDITESMLSFWKNHESLQPFINAGIVDFAIMDAEAGLISGNANTTSNTSPITASKYTFSLQLELSKTTLSTGSLNNPVICVANSVLSSLRHDIVKWENDTLMSAFATLSLKPDFGVAHASFSQSTNVEYVRSLFETLSTAQQRANRAVNPHATTTDGESFLRKAVASADVQLLPQIDEEHRAQLHMVPQVTPGIALSWTATPVTVSSATDTPRPYAGANHPLLAPYLPSLLEYYKTATGVGYFSLPLGGMALQANVSSLNVHNRAVLLVGDYGTSTVEEIVPYAQDPNAWLDIQSTITFRTNLHAMRLYTLNTGGFALQTPYLNGYKCSAFFTGLSLLSDPATGAPLCPEPLATPVTGRSALSPLYGYGYHHPWDVNLYPDTLFPLPVAPAAALCPPLPAGVLAQAAAILVPPLALAQFPGVLLHWAQAMDTHHPDVVLSLVTALCSDGGVAAPLSLRTCLSALRLLRWDPDLLCLLKATVIDASPAVPPKLAVDILRDVQQVYARYYPVNKANDVAFELGRICMGLQCYTEAVGLFLASIRHTAEHQVTAYNIGICSYHLRDYELAEKAFSRALEMRPDYEDAQSWREKTLIKMEHHSVVPLGHLEQPQ